MDAAWKVNEVDVTKKNVFFENLCYSYLWKLVGNLKQNETMMKTKTKTYIKRTFLSSANETHFK